MRRRRSGRELSEDRAAGGSWARPADRAQRLAGGAAESLAARRLRASAPGRAGPEPRPSSSAGPAARAPAATSANRPMCATHERSAAERRFISCEQAEREPGDEQRLQRDCDEDVHYWPPLALRARAIICSSSSSSSSFELVGHAEQRACGARRRAVEEHPDDLAQRRLLGDRVRHDRAVEEAALRIRCAGQSPCPRAA